MAESCQGGLSWGGTIVAGAVKVDRLQTEATVSWLAGRLFGRLAGWRALGEEIENHYQRVMCIAFMDLSI